MGIYIKQTRKKDSDSGYRRFFVQEADYSSDMADVVAIEVDEMGRCLMFEILDNGLIHIWSHSFNLDLTKPIYSTARIKLSKKV